MAHDDKTGTTRTEHRTAKDPEAYVAGFGDNFFWGNRLYKVELESIEPGLTKSGRKRFTIRITDVGPA